MKNQILFFLILAVSLPAFPAFASSEPEPVVINLSYSGSAQLSPGGNTTITGTVTSAKENKTWLDWLLALLGLADNLQANGLELVATFPDEAHDVSSQLQMVNAGKDKIQFTFQANNLKVEDLNRFSLRVFDSKRDKQKLNKLLSIQNKVEKRLQMLKDLKEQHRHNRSLNIVIGIIDAYSSSLSSLIAKIQDRIASDAYLVADYVLPLQVGNTQASLRRSGTKVGNFKVELIATPGTLIEGMATNLKAVVTKLNREQNEPYFLPELQVNGVAAISASPLRFTDAPLVYELPVGPFLSSQNNSISLKVYEWNSNKNKVGDLAASVTMGLTVISDSTTPIWLADSTPSGNNKYLKDAEPLALTISDSFGRIDTSSLNVTLNATLDNGQSSTEIVTGITPSNLGYGQSFLFSKNLNPLEEGVYTLNASIKDLKGNHATPNPWSATFRIDRTAPTITLGVNDNSEHDDESFALPVQIADFSPTTTQVFHNGVQIFTSYDQSFVVNATLIDGINKFEVRSTDIAGNTSEPKVLNSIVFQSVPPQILSSIPANGTTLYAKQFPFVFDVSATIDRLLHSASVNGFPMNISGNQISGPVTASASGPTNLKFDLKRSANGTVTTYNVPINIILDDQRPIITSGIGEILTNMMTYDIPVTISDSSLTFTELWVNGNKVFGTGAKSFLFNISLSLEGENEVKITSVDSAGNAALEKIVKIHRDTVAPSIQLSSPASNSSLGSVIIPIEGTSNEELTSITANGLYLNIGPDKKSFSGNYLAPGQGLHSIYLNALDLAGNSRADSISVTISVPLLVRELVSVTPSGQHVWIVGAQGAARPGLPITASAGFFGTNRDSVTVNIDGSFSLKLGTFDTGTLSISDSSTNEAETMALNLMSETRLSGIIKDVEDNPLPGVTVSLQGTSISTTTSGTGAFSLTDIPVGDQVLIINGKTAPQSVTGATRQFSLMFMKVNIGARQENVIPSTIYLTPLMLDGSQTVVTQNSSATVTSSYAPGVSLHIPVNVTTFPDGQNQGVINIMTVPSDRTPMPPPVNARPSQVLSLEPSGLKFSERIPITLPNIYELPPSTEMVLVSLNSLTGQWEVDGLAAVSENGSSINSKPGHGISHFSLIYAAPIAPTFQAIQDANLGAYDSSREALSTQVALPSFKVGDTSFSPSLTYKTTWARPTAFVSNTIEIPEQRLSFTERTTATDKEYTSITLGKRCGLSWRGYTCHDLYANFYRDTFYDMNQSFTSWYAPTSIKSQFFVGNIRSTEVEETAPPIDGAVSELFNDGKYNGIMSQETVSALAPSLPGRTQISYAVELKKPDSEEYFDSGLYPSLARYRVEIKNFVFTTGTLNVRENLSLSSNVAKNETRQNVVNRANSNLASNVLYGILPNDVTSNIVVQNQTHSPAGRGWRINGAQRILNPQSSTPIVESVTGEALSYQLNNTISTVYAPPASSRVDLKKGLDISAWPEIHAISMSVTKQAQIVKAFGESQSSPQTIFSLPVEAGSINNYGRYACIGTMGTYTSRYHSFKYVPDITSLLRLPDGTYLGLNTMEKSMFSVQGQQYAKMAGNWSPVQQRNESPELFKQYCLSTFGEECGPGTTYYSGACNSFGSHTQTGIIVSRGILGMGTPYVGLPTPGVSFPFQIGVTGNRLVGFNDPQALAVGPDGGIYIADTGLNMVYKFDPSSNQITWYAGSGQNFAFPSGGGSATTTPIYHPRALTTDSQGNLYIASDLGNLIKVNASGFATKIGGQSLEDGGVYANQGHVSLMAFSQPSGLAFDEVSNDLYVADTGYNRVVRVQLNSGQADVVAGTGACNLATAGDGLPATAASLCAPTKITLDSDRNLVVVDSGRNTIRKVIFNRTQTMDLAFAASNKDGSQLTKRADGTWLLVARSGDQFEFDALGKQILGRDGLGQETKLTYNNNGQLELVNFPTSQRIEYQYDGSGRLKKVIDPAGRQTGFAYQGDQLSAVFYPDGTSRSFSYGSNQLLQKEIDARGFETTYHYNAHMRFSGVTKADGSTIHFEDQVSSTIASPGEYTTQSLGGFGFNDPSKTSGTFTNPMSAQTQAITDQNGNVALVKDAENAATVLKYNQNGDPDELITANGQTLRFVYNMATRDHLETWEVISESESKRLFAKTYNSKGQVLTLTDDQGITTTNTYHPTTGLLVRTQKGIDATDFGYDSRGLLISQTTYPSGSDPKTTQFVRNSLGQVVRILTPEGKQFDFTLDSAGNAIEKIENAGATPSITRYLYNSMNRLTSTISPKNEVTEYSYLPTGELESILDAKGNLITFEYDQVGRVTKRTDAHGGVHTMQYDFNGNVIRETDPKGQVKILTYDRVNRLTSVQHPDDIILYSYDEAGRMTSAQNNVSKITYDFDDRGKLQALMSVGLGEMSGMPAFTDTMIYNQHDRLAGRQSSFGSISYGFDSTDRLTSIQTSSNLQFSFGYNNRSQLVSVARNIGRTDIQYTASGSIENMIHSASGVTKSYSSYMYDDRLFTKQKRSIAGQQDYTFDLNGQLTDSSGPVPETFTYDSLGNRISDHDGAFTYDNQGNRLLGDGQFTYQYDLNGNLIAKIPRDPAKTAFHYTYSSRNQLMEVKTLSSALGSEKKRIIFRYDALGRRIFKQVIDYSNPVDSATRKYIFRGSNVLAELDGQNQVLARYTHSPLAPDDILAVEFTPQGVQAGLSQTTGAFFYLKDSIGSVTDLMNQSGQIVQRYTYGAFGNIWSVTDEGGNALVTPPIKTYFAFAGREWDEETGLYYNRARYYDPKIGRFIQEDPHPGSQYDPKSISNRYAYGLNNPLMYTDPDGEWIFLIGLALSALAGGLYAEANGHDFWRGAIAGALIFTAAFYGGAAAASYFGTQGGFSSGFIGGTWGAAVGGATGAVAFPALGAGSSMQGFTFGATVGIGAGAAGGATGGATHLGTPNFKWLGDYKGTAWQSAGKIQASSQMSEGGYALSTQSINIFDAAPAITNYLQQIIGPIEVALVSHGGGLAATGLIHYIVEKNEVPYIERSWADKKN